MLPMALCDDRLKAALGEDLGTGDVTTGLLIPTDQWGRAEIISRQTLRIAGIEIALRVFTLLSTSVRSIALARDGETANRDDVLMEFEGPMSALLAGERVALNFLQRMCGVATLTGRFVDLVEGTGVKILDTRKTCPGMRALDKYAVRVGGGRNHRASLSEGVLIKENHILACGGIRQAVERIRRTCPQLLKVEVESTTLDEVDEAVRAGADIILLDNMSIETIRRAVERVGGAVPLEISGGVTLENVRRLAETGVDGISIGSLTHSAPAADLSMLVRDVWIP